MKPAKKERPILFSAPMVKALLAKTQTRRLVKPQPVGADETTRWSFCVSSTERRNEDRWSCAIIDPAGNTFTDRGRERRLIDGLACPYGMTGDRLWVKETTIIAPPRWGDAVTTNFVIDSAGQKRLVQYLATSPDRSAANDYNLKATPSIFMPRWASRITLEVTGVRVERLQEINREDAIAEGCEMPTQAKGMHPWPEDQYRDLWESINGEGSWKANPWVWVITFEQAA